VRAIFFPDAPRITGYKGVTIRGSLPPEEPTAEELLAQHLKAFPNGRYQADVDLLAAALEVSRKDFAPALARLTRILTDRSHPELAQNASLRFAEVALRLLKFEDRAAIKSALQKNPAALALIKKMAHGETCVARLRPMLPALEE
jgi:predicted negative regulator of RcsB-dependent stress response